MSRVVSAYIAVKFVELMAKPFTEWEAYQLGLIDEDGKKIREPENREEKEQFVSWLNLVRNIKRLMLTIPGGRRKISSYTTAFLLMRESVRSSEERDLDPYEVRFLKEQFTEALEKMSGEKIDFSLIQTESRTELAPGRYRVVGASQLCKDEFLDTQVVKIGENTRSVGHDGNSEIFRVIDNRGGVDYYTHDQLIPTPETNVTGDIAIHPVPLRTKKKKRKTR